MKDLYDLQSNKNKKALKFSELPTPLLLLFMSVCGVVLAFFNQFVPKVTNEWFQVASSIDYIGITGVFIGAIILLLWGFMLYLGAFLYTFTKVLRERWMPI